MDGKISPVPVTILIRDRGDVLEGSESKGGEGRDRGSVAPIHRLTRLE